MAAASDVSYGTWKHSDSPYQIHYALPVFREIEFYVGEGFRRIPYGGIEHGGLLFGKRVEDVVHIEAFRPVECEHAAGPSFSLSEKDVAVIRQQLASYTEQQELAGLVPAGIFISHSRRGFEVTGDEQNLLRELFSEPWQFLLIVKPEKFKPASFAFVFRAETGMINTSVADSAFVLPTPPRAGRKSRPDTPAQEPAAAAAGEPAPEQNAKTTRPRTRKTAAKLKPLEEVNVAPEVQESIAPHALPSRPSEEPSARVPEAKSRPYGRAAVAAILFSLIPLAACFLWFYWHYLEPPIDIHAVSQPDSIVLTWPSDTTAGALRARLRIWSNQRDRIVALSPDEKNTGRAIVAISSDDVTIELVASYWLHERRGLVRVITGR
jgi:hypothetical protein